MKSFKLLTIIAGILALAALSSCAEKVEDPFIKIDGEKEFNLTKEQRAVTVKVLSNRDWGVRVSEKASDWIVVEPKTGKASDKPTEVTITVLANSGANRSTAIEFYTGTASEMVTINQEGPDGDSDGVEAISVAEFISRGSNGDTQTYYRLSGTVSSFKTGTSSAGKDYMQFNLTDDSGIILVYGFAGGQYEEWATKIKNGGTVTLQGQYEFYSAKSQHEVVNATIESFTAGQDQTEFTSKTVADFIATASATTKYRLTGTVSAFKTGNNNGRDWMQFNLTDATGIILVYGFEDGQFAQWSSKIKDNGTVVLVGTYEYYSQKEQHEVMNAVIESFSEGEAPQASVVTVAEAIALADNAPLIIEEATVAGKSTMGIVVTGGSANAYIYFDTKAGETIPAVSIGDKVKIEATKSTYNGIPELVKATVTKLSAGEMTYPDPKDITATAATYEASVSEYVKITGTLSTSESNGNKYYNLTIPGVAADTRQGSLAGPLPELNVDALDGQDITVVGYLTGFASKGKYINILVTEVMPADPNVKYCTASPMDINVKADDTSASFEIRANAAWTLASDDAAFSVSPASGEGNATVTVTFAANETESSKMANITLVCEEAGVRTTITITQKAAGAADEHPFTSNVTWTGGTNFYDQNTTTAQSATINGESVTQFVKLGKGGVGGDFTVTLPSGTTKVGFFALAWNNKSSTLTITGAASATIKPKSNSGVAQNAPYTITTTEEEAYYEVNITNPSAGLKFEATGERVVLWGINAY